MNKREKEIKEKKLGQISKIIEIICNLGDFIMEGDNLVLRVLAYFIISIPCFVAFYFLFVHWVI